MDASDIQDAFKSNWMFQLFGRKPDSFSNAWLPLLIPVIFWAVGLVIALFQGVGQVFFFSPLSLMSPVAMGLTLLAYWWFTIAFPNALVMLQAALDEDPAEQESFKIRTARWGVWFGGWRFIIPVTLITVIFGLVASIDIVRLFFGGVQDGSLWASWVNSDSRAFFQAYSLFVQGLVLPALLSSGFVTLLASVLIMQDLLRLPLKLAYYRRLRALGDLSIGISLWTLLAIGGIALFGLGIITSQPAVLHPALLLTIPLFASFGLVFVLFTPVILGRWAIIRAKRVKIAAYEAQLHKLSVAIDALISPVEAAPGAAPPEGVEPAPEPANPETNTEAAHPVSLEKLLGERQTLNQQIAEVEAIQTLPISWVGLLQLVFTAASPSVGVLFADAIDLLETIGS